MYSFVSDIVVLRMEQRTARLNPDIGAGQILLNGSNSKWSFVMEAIMYIVVKGSALEYQSSSPIVEFE